MKKPRYEAGDIIRDKEGFCTIIKKDGIKYKVYDCNSNGIPTKPSNYRTVAHKDIIELIHG